MHLTAQKYTTNSCRGYSYADPERFVRGGPTVTFFVVVGFLLDEGREYQNTTRYLKNFSSQNACTFKNKRMFLNVFPDYDYRRLSDW